MKKDKIKLYLRIGKTLFSADKIWELKMMLPSDIVLKLHLTSEERATTLDKNYSPKPLTLTLPKEIFDAVNEGIKQSIPKYQIQESIELTSSLNDVVIVKYIVE